MPLAVGEYVISLTENGLRFNDASVVNTATVEYAECGTIYIDAITETKVSGRVVASADNSEINGSFVVSKCAE